MCGRILKKSLFLLGIQACMPSYHLHAQDMALPPPQKNGGMPLMEAMNSRKSAREFGDREIPKQALSDLLWAAYGFNRPQQKMRTVPSAMNVQNMDVYAAMADGLYRYDAAGHVLKLVLQKDVRAATGQQSFAASAPLNLVYVADASKMSGSAGRGDFYSNVHAGFISQNVYLFCASAGLVTVVRDMIDRAALKTAMGLAEPQQIILAQTVGYPKETGATGQAEPAAGKNAKAALDQNHPNPFNSETEWQYVLAENARVTVAVYDVQGRKVRTVLDESQPPGRHMRQWDGLDGTGKRMESGVYFCELNIREGKNPRRMIRKMLMLK